MHKLLACPICRWDEELYASDYFDRMYECAEMLIKKGLAFVCDMTGDEIRENRGTLTTPGKNSPFRNRSVEENLDLFRRMKNGEFPDGSKVLRAKIDMASPNINMRDPIIYRILRETHHRTGDKWCIYPMYDFAHPLEDAFEGMIGSLTTIALSAFAFKFSLTQNSSIAVLTSLFAFATPTLSQNSLIASAG